MTLNTILGGLSLDCQ